MARILALTRRARIRALGIALSLLLAGGAAACRQRGLSSPGAPVVVISVDTLRADHLPAYGYKGVETPNLDALRADSVLFVNAYSHVPLTLPSHVSLFTGLLPPQNGVRDNLGYSLGPGPATIASALKAAGYATGGAVSSVVLSHATGVSRGFDFWEDDVEPTKVNQSLSRVQRAGDETERLLADWIGSHQKGRVFAFLHLFEPHAPYEPPEPYRSRYASRPYDGEIARADEIVGRLVAFLKERGLYEKALVVFLSDHGEGLNDHGEDEHGVLLYREEIHVPLFVKFPGARRAGESVASPVALTDVFPTIAEVAGVAPPAGLAGRSLTLALAEKGGAAASEPRRVYSETLYPRLHLGWSDLASLTDDRHQFIESPKPELYDVVADPGEKHDLARGSGGPQGPPSMADVPPAFRALSAALAKIPRPLQPPGASDPESVKKLASLGYISATTADLTRKDLPSPRERIGSVAKLKEGFGDLQGSRFAEAASVFHELLEADPGMVDVWQLYADACLKLGRDEDALAALQSAARISPGNPQVLMALSDYYFATGNYAEARKHAELVGEAGPSNPHENLARIALAEGKLDEAEREARAALERYPSRRLPHFILGRVARERRDYAGALEEFALAAHAQDRVNAPPMQNLSFFRGDCLARLGRDAEAEQAFQEELRDYPSNPAPRTALALLYASQGREADARQSLTRLVQDLHTPEAYFAAARTYEVLGDPRTAEELRSQARRIFPKARERKETG
jgi:arylsulfatase A-like enzyme/tetratricopeptide (TPR) repeat protein